jgi:solute:Na+ symporter, SSS family
MTLSWVDYLIIGVYLTAMLAIGIVCSRRASRSLESYFLGERGVNWFLLGMAGMTMYFDMSGTMMQAGFYYEYGVKGFLIAFRGAMPLLLAFMMLFMGKWLNRSGVMTNAELLELRFGAGKQGQAARLICAVGILIQAVAFCVFLLYGSGKFLSLFTNKFTENECMLIFFGITMFYTVISGFYGVVFTDLVQGMLIAVAVVWIMVLAMTTGTPEYFQKYTDPSWHTLSLADWTKIVPEGHEFRPLKLLLFFWIAQGLLLGVASPHDAWTSQKFYAAKDTRASALTACTWILTFSIRFAMYMAIGVLAVGIKDKISDPEKALPMIFEHYFPMGLRGLMISAMLAAGMSTLSGMTNSTAAYFINDIYKKHLAPQASNKQLVWVSYGSSFAITAVGLIIAMNATSISSIWGWIFMSLFAGVLASNVLKWFWWRFNGMGYTVGMAFGVAAAVTQDKIPGLGHSEYAIFSFVLAVSTVGAVVGTFFGKPADERILLNFYRRIRPFGFWGPIRRQVDGETVRSIAKENRHDLLLLIPALVWQIMLFWSITVFVVKQWTMFAWSAAITVGLSVLLYYGWYRRLGEKQKV